MMIYVLKTGYGGRLHFPFTESAAKQLSMLCAVHRNPIIQQFLREYNYLLALIEILFCRLPSHINIRGNELADLEAKSALSLSITNLKNPHSDLKSNIHQYVMNKCQSFWKNKLKTNHTN